MNKKRFGKKVREKRQELGYTQEQLADLCPMHVGYLKQIENGSKLPALPLLIKMCEVLHTSPNYLFGFSEDKNIQDILDSLYSLTPYQLKAVKYLVRAYAEFEKGVHSKEE